MLFGAWNLGRYIYDFRITKQHSDEMRRIYREAVPLTKSVELPHVDISDAADIIVINPGTAADDETSGWYASMLDLGVKMPLVSTSRFEKIRRMNDDIVGWLKIDGMVDEAIVQRDNEYYLKRDYRGYHNVNGALFLDETCSIAQSPTAHIIYGHNMKTGAMFGDLQEYRKPASYQNNPFIQFDTLYADGAYVIFAVSEVSVLEGAYRYVDFYRLPNCGPIEKERILDRINKNSLYISPIDAQAEDDILILVTCLGDDSERFIVAARKIREGESRASLQSKMAYITVR